MLRHAKSVLSPSRAMKEFHAGMSIHSRGITTAVPLFMAERSLMGFVRQSLIVMPFITEAMELKDLFFNRMPDRKEMLERFGQLTGEIFSQGVFQNDYSLNNFIVGKINRKPRIYFIDFERVSLKDRLSEPETIFLLSKLNRVGREITTLERLIFLKGYLGAGSCIDKTVSQLALKIRENTVQVLKRDLKRCRMTSLYTHGHYNRLKTDIYTGLYEKGCSAEEIIKKKDEIFASEISEVSLMFKGHALALKTIQLKKQDAEWLWSCITVFVIAGLPLQIPHVLVCNSKCGVIMAVPSMVSRLCSMDRALRSVSLRFIKGNFSEELGKMKKLLDEGLVRK
jgi:tRNA A-37 threonylcarbamoyl transferase component Bud32